MTQTPITRTIVWTGQRWVDQKTGVWANNLPAPADSSPAPSYPGFSEEQWDLIKTRIDKVLADRVAPEKPSYFVHNDWLITYAQLTPVIHRQHELERRIAVLEERRDWRRRLLKWVKGVLRCR